MANLLISLLLALVSMLSLFPPAFAGPVRVARTRQAHDEYLRQRQLRDRERKLTDVVYRGSLPPVHLVETKFSFEKDRREEERRNQGGAASSAATPIKYHGGPVMSSDTLNVYLIYYGSWPVGSGQDVIENFIRSLGLSGSDAQGEAGDPKVSNWWATSSKYYSKASDGSTNTVSKEVNLTKVIWDKGSRGKKLGPRGPWKIVKSRIGSGKPLPYDADGIYLLLTSKDVKVAGYCSQYCGWHTMDYLNSKPVVYSLVGHHGRCPKNCGAQRTSPNGNPGLDATVSTIAHEIAEAATDPDASSGWFDANNEENADKCSYDYGETLTTQNGKGEDAQYNLVGLNNMTFLVQQNWDVTTHS
ncbi:unnamed protein product, partial [Closterium sp. NIES-53]